MITVRITKPYEPTRFAKLDSQLEELKDFFCSTVSLTAKFSGQNNWLQFFHIMNIKFCVWNSEMLEKIQIAMSFYLNALICWYSSGSHFLCWLLLSWWYFENQETINQTLLKREVLITNKTQTEQDIALYVTNLENIHNCTVANRKLLKGLSACEPVTNQQILSCYSFCSFSDNAPHFLSFCF